MHAVIWSGGLHVTYRLQSVSAKSSEVSQPMVKEMTQSKVPG